MHDAVEPDPADVDAWWRRLHQRPVTAGLMLVCVLAYAATFAAAVTVAEDPWTTATRSLWTLEDSEAVLLNFGALELTRVWLDHEWWRVLTTGLLHGSLLHLVLNMTALGSIGDWVEHAWGSWRTFLLFLAASVAGCLASMIWCESRMVVGASAGVLGQAGALWVARQFGGPRLQAALEPVSVLSLGILLLLCLFLGTVIPGIAQAGHVGGLGMGVLCGALLARSWPRWLQALGVTALIGILVGLGVLGSAPVWQSGYHTMLGFRALDDQNSPAATAHFEHALERDPESAALRNTVAYQFALAGVELDRAELLVRKALADDPTNGSYLDTLGWVWCRKGEAATADPILRAGIFLSGDADPELLAHVSNCASSAAPR